MSDGALGIPDLLNLIGNSYDVIAITDHDTLTIPHPLHLKQVKYDKPTLRLLGIEYSAHGMIHLIGLEPTQPYGTSIEIWDSCRVKWIAHPRLSDLSYDQLSSILENFPSINGMEIFNSGILQISDNTEDFPMINYYASDDLHEPYQIKASWMEMDVDELDKELIIGKLIDGSFDICTSNSKRNPLLISLDKSSLRTP